MDLTLQGDIRRNTHSSNAAAILNREKYLPLPVLFLFRAIKVG
jgi:hypothetical protein